MRRQYPLGYDGLPVDPSELDLRPSTLNPNNQRNWSNHHLAWERRRYELGGVVLRTFRNMEGMQVDMLNDQHNYGKFALHTLFDPPRIPDPAVMIDFILNSVEHGEQMRLWDANSRSYYMESVPSQTLYDIRHTNLDDLRNQL